MDMVKRLQGFHADTVPVAELLRAILGHPRWHVLLDDRGSPDLADEDDVLWLCASAAPPAGPHVVLDGRQLIRGLPDTAGGVVLEPETEHAVTFLREQLPSLLAIADALDVQQALLRPAQGQASLLHTAIWRAAVGPDGRPIVHAFDHGELVPLFTADDTADLWLRTELGIADGVELAAFEGPELFAALAARDDHDGIVFDEASAEIPPVGPNFGAALAEGRDERPAADVLPARSVAEIHLYLDLLGADRAGRTHALESRPTGLCAAYTVRWTRFDWGRPAFEPCEPNDDPEDLGEGPTRILCAGLLLDAVRARLGGYPDDPTAMRPEERPRAASAARWLWELEKLCEGDRIPRSAIRTAEGARAFRDRPECTTREWVLAVRQRAEALAGTV